MNMYDVCSMLYYHILSMIYNLVCDNHIHEWIRTTSHDFIPKGSKRSNMTIFRVCEWKASRSWRVDVCNAYIYISIYTLWKSHRLTRNICFKWISTVCWALRSAASENGKCSTAHRKLMWVLWFAILADLQRLLQPLCRIYSTFASRTFNLELAFE